MRIHGRQRAGAGERALRVPAGGVAGGDTDAALDDDCSGARPGGGAARAVPFRAVAGEREARRAGHELADRDKASRGRLVARAQGVGALAGAHAGRIGKGAAEAQRARAARARLQDRFARARVSGCGHGERAAAKAPRGSQ